MQKLKTVLFLIFFVICFLGSYGPVNAQEQFKIEGQVLDKDNNPLPGVLIRLYRGSTPLTDHKRTGRDGTYSISFPPGIPISKVRYDLTNWYPSLVENISGMRDHRINKVLMPSGGKMSVPEYQEVYTTFVKLKTLDLENGITNEKFSNEYGELFETLGDEQKKLHTSTTAAGRTTGVTAGGFPGVRPRLSDSIDPMGSFIGGIDKKASLVDIHKSQAQRVTGSAIRINVEVQTNSGGWKVFTIQSIIENQLHVYVVGQSASNNSSEAPANYSISETYNHLLDVTQVVFHGSKGNTTVDVAKGK